MHGRDGGKIGPRDAAGSRPPDRDGGKIGPRDAVGSQKSTVLMPLYQVCRRFVLLFFHCLKYMCSTMLYFVLFCYNLS